MQTLHLCSTGKAHYMVLHVFIPSRSLRGEQRRHNIGLNAEASHAEHVVVVKAHRPRTGLTQDLVLSLRPLAIECSKGGYHFYILYSVSRDF